VEYSSKIGYDAHQMADFFGTLKKISSKSGASIPTFQSTHPDPGNRQVTVEKLATNYQSAHQAKYNVNRDVYLRKIEGLIYGIDPKQGFVEGGQFYHPALKFQFPVPSDWQSENTPAQFQMASKDGKAMMLFTLAEGKSLDEAAQTVIKNYGLQVSENNKVTINGNPAIAMVAKQVAQGQTAAAANAAQVASWLIQYNGSIYAIHGVAASTDFGASYNQFKSVAQGFKALTDASKLNRQPERIHIKTVQNAGTLRDVLKANNMPDNKLDDLAILNGMELTAKVEKGMLIKTLGN